MPRMRKRSSASSTAPTAPRFGGPPDLCRRKKASERRIVEGERKAMRTNLLRCAVASLVVAAVTGFAGAASAADAGDTLRYGIDDEQNINRLPQVIAEREGLFAREGLKVELVPFKSSFRARAAGQDPG